MHMYMSTFDILCDYVGIVIIMTLAVNAACDVQAKCIVHVMLTRYKILYVMYIFCIFAVHRSRLLPSCVP